MLTRYSRETYRTSDGSMLFDFLFCEYSDLNTWRIYIINNISYSALLSDNYHLTHRLHDIGEDYDYICWEGSIATLDKAKAVASLWADCTAIMIKTGRGFDSICAELLKKEDD